jgi:replicative DNA helicase Mcm
MSRSARPQDDGILQDFEEFYKTYYQDEIALLAQRYPSEQKSLYIEASDLYKFDSVLYDDWLSKPGKVCEYAEEALVQYDLPADVNLENAHVRLTDSDGFIDERSVAQLSSDHIGNYAAVSGQLARITGKSPRITTTVYECQRCGTPAEVPQDRNDTQEPHECPGCERQGPFRIVSDESEWVDQRKIKLEEPIEDRSQPRGQSIPVYVEDDLCDYGPGQTQLPDHAGEHATIVGTVRVDESQLTGRNSGPETDLWIDAKAIVFDTEAKEDIDVEEYRDEFESFAAHDNAVDLVAESLAPSLHADEGDDLYTARRACAAWLFNAYRLDPEGGESKRGDLHMALIGDPGTGKSTLMGYLNDVLPKSEFRTGTGLSEVGLTAAAVQEEFAGATEWTLQPGILPRADGGHCLIDEIDGVVDENTKAIHDALEGEQMVKADKAGIKADLPTRTALLAGGNPTYTRFDKYEPISEQIDLDPALFDRMDLVFALQDTVEEESDRKKAGHTLDAWDELTRADHGDLDVEDAETTSGPVPEETLRAWIAYARDNVFPQLTPEAKQALEDYYVEVRDLNDGYDSDKDVAVPATMRTLEAGIRLSISFARLRLSDTVSVDDAQRAIELTKEVVGLNYDPDSGQFDDRRTSKGETQSQRKRRKAIIDIVNELAGEEPAPHDDVVDRIVSDCDVDESKAEHELEELCHKGELYTPQQNHYRTS